MTRYALPLLAVAFGLALLPAPADPPPMPGALVFPPRDGERLIYVYDAIDGDTVRFYWLVEDTGRLYGINAPESHGPTKAAGLASRNALLKLLPVKPCKAVVHGREKFGRALLDVYDDTGRSLSKLQADAGQAKPWDGKGPRP
jgi:endonuclease YncB( thermonuclease family)